MNEPKALFILNLKEIKRDSSRICDAEMKDL